MKTAAIYALEGINRDAELTLEQRAALLREVCSILPAGDRARVFELAEDLAECARRQIELRLDADECLRRCGQLSLQLLTPSHA